MKQKEKFIFKDLKVWQRAVKFTQFIYKVTESFPDHEKFGLMNQLRRSTVSVALNIAEGKGRGYDAEFLRFLNIARASLY